MAFGKFYREYARLGEYMQGVFYLGLRLVLAAGFSEAARMKWEAMPAVIEWFGTLGYPAPAFLAYLVSGVESAGVVLLALGLFTRLISVPLMIIMLTAIFTVHLSNGFECSNNGFEIPLYFLMMLGVLFSSGSGRFSLDHLFFKGV